MSSTALRRRDTAPHRSGTVSEAAASDSGDFAAAVRRGLSGHPKAIPAKFFYDRRGSELFEQICDLPEYYPTRTEIALLETHADEIAAAIGPEAALIEFGAGALRKVRLLLDALPRLRAYLPIDISGDHLNANAAALAADHPGLAILPVVADFTAALDLPALPSGARRVGFFPGSSIGNFTPDEARHFLQRAAKLLSGGGLLIGVDLVKDPAILHAAYNDAAGVTAAFNLNLLHRINAELGGDADPDGFAHYAFYQPQLQRIEMHLVSRRAQSLRIGGAEANRARHDFAAGESIHTENSYKYTLAGFRQLAEQSGFHAKAVWRDPERLFSLHWLVAA